MARGRPARSAADQLSSSATLPLCLHALRLADQNGIELQANVARRAARLLMAYQRAGFSSCRTIQVSLSCGDRPPRPVRTGRKQGLGGMAGTGRVSADKWRARFGAVPSPVLDVGAGDSTLVPELDAAGIPAVAVDPQFSLRPPAWALPCRPPQSARRPRSAAAHSVLSTPRSFQPRRVRTCCSPS